MFGLQFLRLERLGGASLPLLVALVAVIMMSLPLVPRIGDYGLMPALPLVAIFTWVVFRPEYFFPIGVLVTGLALDLSSGAPIGFWTFIYVVAATILNTQRYAIAALAPRDLWIAFAIFIALVAGFTWVTISVYFGQFVSPLPILIEGIVTVLLYPLFRRIFDWLQRFTPPAL